jgi:hypothetical protein
MIIINPVVTTSNIESLFEDGSTSSYAELMNFKCNDQLNRTLTKHNVEFALLKRNLNAPFRAGHMLKIDIDSIVVLTIGVSPGDEAAQKEVEEDIKIQVGSEEAIFIDSAFDIPGAKEVLLSLENKGIALKLTWLDVKNKIKSMYGVENSPAKKEVDV